MFLIGCLIGKSLGDTPFIMGYILTCIYGGWSIVDMFFANIFITLDIHSIIFYYGLKAMLSMIVGIVATPVFLGYCVFKLVENARK